MKKILVTIFAITAVYLMLTLPVSYATTVNIIHGSTTATTNIDAGQIISKQIIPKNNFDQDRRGTAASVSIKVNGASLLHQINKVYIYMCKSSAPMDCLQTTPIDSGEYADVDLSWNFVSIPQGGNWPETANFLILVKSTDSDGNVLWHGFFDTVKRMSWDTFTVESTELSEIDAYVKSSNFVESAKNFVEKNHMLPFSWMDRVIFKGASEMQVIRGSQEQFDSVPLVLNPVNLPGNQIDQIGDQYTVVFPNSGGIKSPITLNINPSYTCGNGDAEIDLGENSENCCYDVGCGESEYCDFTIGNSVDSGECKQLSDISLSVTPVTVPEITTCGAPVELSIIAQITGSSSLEDTITGMVTLGGDEYAVTCTASGATYTCPVTYTPTTTCGSGDYYITGNDLSLTVSFNDGPSLESKSLEASINDIHIEYTCSCPVGQYCDATTKECQLEALGLVVQNVDSTYKDSYTGGTDQIVLTISAINPPGGLTVQSTSYTLGNISYGTGAHAGASGVPDCTTGADHVYTCTIPFSVPDYDHEKKYVIGGNSIGFEFTYPDGSITQTKNIEVGFSDITIPSYRCGDGNIDPEENPTTCCLDAGCTSDAYYCDKVSGCKAEADISISLTEITPIQFEDCDLPHEVEITAKIHNLPSTGEITTFRHDSDTGSLDLLGCTQPHSDNGLFDCTLVIPVLIGCTLPNAVVGDNTLEVTLKYDDGDLPVIKTLNLPLGNITVKPIYTCGDGVCESDLLESKDNCCRDCPCPETYYCAYDPSTDDPGSCEEKTEVFLVLDDMDTNLKNCEIDHDVNIIAHVHNPPPGIRIGNAYAHLGDENTGRIRCQQENVPGLAHNFTLTCILTIPRVDMCSVGDGTYEYTGNKMYLYVSYFDTLGQRVTQELPVDLHDVTITQDFRTIFDIMEDSKNRMEQKFKEMKSIVEDALDNAKTCKEWMMKALYAMMFATMLGVLIGIPPGGASVLQGAQAGALVGGTFLEGVKTYCDMMNTFTKVELQLKEIEIKEIEMDTCIALYQHDLDSDRCKGQEMSCFEQIKACLNTIDSMNADLTEIQKDYTDLSDRMQGSVDSIVDDLKEADELLQGQTGKANLLVECNGNQQYCCEFAGQKFYRRTPTGNPANDCTPNRLTAHVTSPKDCPNPIIVFDGNMKYVTHFDPINIWSDSYPSDHVFQVYCDANADGNPDPNELIDKSSKRITYIEAIKDEDDEFYCKCAGITPTQVGTAPGLSELPTIEIYTDDHGGSNWPDEDGKVYAYVDWPDGTQKCEINWKQRIIFADDKTEIGNQDDDGPYEHTFGSGTHEINLKCKVTTESGTGWVDAVPAIIRVTLPTSVCDSKITCGTCLEDISLDCGWCADGSGSCGLDNIIDDGCSNLILNKDDCPTTV